MLKLRFTKKQITGVVLKQIPKNLNYDLDGRSTPEDFISKWWYTGRGEGLRLTEAGDDAFRIAQIEFYEYPIGNINTNYYGFLTELNKKILCPYFLGLNTSKQRHEPIIRLYDSEIAMLIVLYGSLREYLNSIRTDNDRRK